MAILSTDLIAFASASLPTTDSATTGGAIDITRRPVFTQFGANAVVAIISDGADTRNVTVTGRLATGVIDTDIIALNGAVEALGVKTFERILKVEAATTSGTRTVTVKQGTGGSTIGTIPINETGFYALFYDSASDPVATKTRHEKIFWKNNHGTLTLTSAAMKLTADPSSKIRIGCAPSVGDSATVANRLAVPASVSFVDDNVSQAVPGNALAAGAAIGVWIEQALGIGDAPVRSTFTTQLSGQST
jgi:hypothetical protein